MGAYKDMQDIVGYTPLMLAAGNGDTEVVRLLIEAGADKDVQNSKKVTALIYAVTEGMTEVTRLLIDSGVNKDVCNKFGDTALTLAARTGSQLGMEIARLLIAAGADKDVQNDIGEIVLMFAAVNDDVEVVRMLIDAGADKDVQNVAGETADGGSEPRQYSNRASAHRSWRRQKRARRPWRERSVQSRFFEAHRLCVSPDRCWVWTEGPCLRRGSGHRSQEWMDRHLGLSRRMRPGQRFREARGALENLREVF